jgi:hypothetical protein
MGGGHKERKYGIGYCALRIDHWHLSLALERNRPIFGAGFPKIDALKQTASPHLNMVPLFIEYLIVEPLEKNLGLLEDVSDGHFFRSDVRYPHRERGFPRPQGNPHARFQFPDIQASEGRVGINDTPENTPRKITPTLAIRETATGKPETRAK